jgi:hypothetical protein
MAKASNHPAHDLMPNEIAQTIPPLYATQNEKDPTAHLKLFTPDNSWTFYVLEFDPGERLCFGLVVGQERELGYFRLDELEAARGPLRLPIERDLHWSPRPLSECQ